jgi:hypothetical protein
MANENGYDNETKFTLYVQMSETNFNTGKWFTKVATEKKLVYYNDFDNEADAKADYQKLLNIYGYGE